MVDYQRQLLDELMGRNRDLNPGAKVKERTWKDSENCKFFLHSFCPHDLFVNTRADLGPCLKLHDEEIKNQYQTAARCPRKIDIENDFVRFITSMITEVDRKIVKGKQRLELMNSKLDNRPVSKQAEAVHTINDKISKLVKEAEEAGIRGDVDQAQNLMILCEKLKEDKESLIKQYESCGFNFNEAQEKQMEVCETCGAFLIVGDAQSRIDDHLMGKQHIGYTRLRKALEEHRNNPEREVVNRRSGSRSSRDRDRRDRRDDRSRYRDDHRRRSRDDRRERDRDRDRDRDRNKEHRHKRDRRTRSRDRRSKSRSKDRHRRRSRS